MAPGGGGTHLLPCSHRAVHKYFCEHPDSIRTGGEVGGAGAAAAGQNNPQRLNALVSEEIVEGTHELVMDAGDVCFWHHWMCHDSNRNVGDLPRQAIFSRFHNTDPRHLSSRSHVLDNPALDGDDLGTERVISARWDVGGIRTDHDLWKWWAPAVSDSVRASPAAGTGVEAAGVELAVDSGGFSGLILDNVANADREGAGFNPLRLASAPAGANIFRDDAVGLNFEHVFNGTAVSCHDIAGIWVAFFSRCQRYRCRQADRAISKFTPRRDACALTQLGPRSFTVTHTEADSSWGMASRMVYTFPGGGCVDLAFEATPVSIYSTRSVAPLGYVACMWASYMGRTDGREIHFRGQRDGGPRDEWIAFGSEPRTTGPSSGGGDFERGTVGWIGAEPLPYEEGSESLNVEESPSVRFSRPFFFGLATEPDGTQMCYAMFFERPELHRLAMWNFIPEADGTPNDPRSPAWDWHFVMRHPEVGKTYGYRARVQYKRFSTREQVERDYDAWLAGLGASML